MEWDGVGWDIYIYSIYIHICIQGLQLTAFLGQLMRSDLSDFMFVERKELCSFFRRSVCLSRLLIGRVEGFFHVLRME